MSAAENRPSHSDAAVIDVGSNSVRLVLYRFDGRAIWSVFNEKVLAGLGRDLARTGRLSPDGVRNALLALSRFKVLVDARRPIVTFSTATAAVRDASDGAQFCARVERETGIVLRVLSGEEEARYAALGVLAGAPMSKGLVGDLGGGSLELMPVTRRGPRRGLTLPLGPFSMDWMERFDPDAVRSTADKRLKTVGRRYRSDTLHAVGGAWRNLALLHMRTRNYPLEIVHGYEMSRQEVLDATRLISLQSKTSLERISGIAKRRLDTLPHAAVILGALVERLDIQRVVLSAYGLREGLVWEAMANRFRALDPLIAGCEALGNRQAVAQALGQALERWAAPVFATSPPLFGHRDRTLLAAASRLAELGAQLHPDHRAHLIFEQVLRAPIAGLDHCERAFLALAAFGRYTSTSELPNRRLLEHFLSPERRSRALAIGAALRLGCEISGRSPELLARTQVRVESGSLILSAQNAWAPLFLGETTKRRARTLARLLELDLEVQILDDEHSSAAMPVEITSIR